MSDWVSIHVDIFSSNSSCSWVSVVGKVFKTIFRKAFLEISFLFLIAGEDGSSGLGSSFDRRSSISSIEFPSDVTDGEVGSTVAEGEVEAAGGEVAEGEVAEGEVAEGEVGSIEESEKAFGRLSFFRRIYRMVFRWTPS